MSTLVATNLKHNASATNNIVLDAAGNVQVAGVAANLYPLVSATAQNSTSGTFVDFTGIPAWVRRITVMFNGVSTNGSSILMVQVGAGSIATTGYLSSGSAVGASSAATTTSTVGFIFGNSNAASGLSIGSLVLTNIAGNNWIANGAVYMTASPATHFCFGSSPTLAGTLDRVRITTVNGTDQFDAGSINIMYE